MSDSETIVESDKISIGEPLKKARVKAGLSIEQVALRMNLDVDIIVSIEEDAFKDNLSPAFYRGYIRTYANLIALPSDEIVEKYNRFIHEDSLATHITPTFENKVVAAFSANKSFWPKRIAVALLLFIVLLAIYFFYNKFSHSTSSPEIDIQSTAVSLENTQAEQKKDERNSLTSEAKNGSRNHTKNNVKPVKVLSGTLPASKNIGSKSLTQSSNQKPPGSNNKPLSKPISYLEMVFSGNCWVKVTDATGEVLAIGIKRAGKKMTLTGIPPFKVILGNATVVKIKLNGLAVDLSSYSSGQRVELTLSPES